MSKFKRVFERKLQKAFCEDKIKDLDNYYSDGTNPQTIKSCSNKNVLKWR